MANNLTELLYEAENLNSKIKQFLKSATYDRYDDISGLEIDLQDPEELFLWDELRGIAGSLDDAYKAIAYLSLPIESTSVLHRRADGRYESEDGYTYTCGSPIEALIEDDRRDVPYWVLSRIEADSDGYYIVYHKGALKDGIMVRRRRRY